jgi:hypothetical protein
MSFKYIDPDNVGYTANDADELESIDFSKMLPGQVKEIIFRIGNTGSSPADYTVTGETVNSGILPAFDISDDGDDYVPVSSGIVISSLAANQISRPLYLRFTVPDDGIYIDGGTIRISTTES